MENKNINPNQVEYIYDADMADFEAKVLEASMNVPVLVDFWSSTCGPCKDLMPILEKTTKDYNGAFNLAKVNVEKNQAIAMQLRIQSVPTVYAFFQGMPVDAFAGAIKESELKKFIERVFATCGLPLSGNRGQAIDELMELALKALDDGDIDSAVGVFSQVLQEDHENYKAMGGLLRCYVKLGQIEEAKQIIAQLDDKIKANEHINAVIKAIELIEESPDASIIDELEAKLSKNPDDLGACFELAKAFCGVSNYEKAAEALVTIIKKDASWNEGVARSQLLKIFEALGNTHPMTIKARKIMSVYCFS